MPKYLSIIAFLVFSTFSLFGQEPSYVIVGDNELAGLDIYTMAQDKNNFIWLGTENGLYKYDGYEFIKYNNENLKTKSVFGFIKDNYGELFCFNLSGQILHITQHKIEIHYQIPDSLLSSFFEIGFDFKNQLIVAGNNLFYVDSKNKPHLIFENKPFTFQSSFKKTNDHLLFSYNNGEGNGIIQTKDYQQFNKIKISDIESSPSVIIQNKNGYTVAKERDKLSYYELKNNSITNCNVILEDVDSKLISSVSYITSDSTLWQSTRTGGLIAHNQNKNEAFHDRLLFKNYFISSYLEDHEGNLWLATLGKGLLFIPNKKLYSFRNVNGLDNEVFTNVISNEKSTWLSTQSGKIFKFHDYKFSLIYNQNNTKINILKLDKTNERLVFNGEHTNFALNLKDNTISEIVQIGALKDLDFVNDSILVFASNAGVRFVNRYKNVPTSTNFILPEQAGRTSAVCYQPTENKIWVSTLKGLMVLSENKAPFYFETIFASDIIHSNNSIWVATRDNGIYEFNSGKISTHFSHSTGLVSDVIYKIKIINDNLFIAHEKGFQIINLKTKTNLNIDKTDGLFLNRISNFTVQNNIVLLTTNKGLQTFNLNEINKNNATTNINIKHLLINNKKIDEIKPFYNLTFDENNIELTFTSNSFRHLGALKYAYKIDELNTDWLLNNFTENSIKFSSLSPGNYTLKIKAINENNIESEPISIRFIISKPFWETWWFYLCLGLIFIAVTILVYRSQLKKQHKKITLQNELNASKLIAIQSQMNPHFIFNAINSIQDLILQGDIDNSYSYIIKFSKLVRKTLDYSGKEFIDIEDEIELLSIYLELEKLRFKADFSYNIITNDIEDIQVPPMLIQPFVENAIKHGLLHKEGNKSVTITFELGDILTCIIEDNGIGRKKAQEIKDRQQKTHKSFSVSATETRFNIMKSHYQQDLGITYQDLYTDGTPIGTKVIIQIPINRNY